MEAHGGDVVRIGSLELRFLVDEMRGSGNLAVFEFVVPPSARVPAAHFHKEVDQVIYALEGTTTTTLDGHKHELRPGRASSFPGAAFTRTRTCTARQRGLSSS